MKIKNRKGYVLALLAAICFGSIGTLSKLLSNQGLTIVSTTILTSISFIIAGLVYALVKSPNIFKISLKALLMCIIYGAVMSYLSKVFYLKAIAILPVAICSTIMFTMIFPTMFVSKYLFKESITPVKIILSVIALGGVIMALNVFSNGAFYPLLAIIFILITTLLCASMNLSSNYLINKGYSALTITFYGNISLFVVLLLVQPPTKSISNIVEVIKISPSTNISLMILLSLGALGSILFFINSLKYISITDATIILSFDPITSTIWGFLIFGERLSNIQLLGGLIIILAVMGVSLSDSLKIKAFNVKVRGKFKRKIAA